MAITKDDFARIWASTSPLTPYSFSESNYKEGWNFVGSTPPARQMWDFLQKNNDEKMQFLLALADVIAPVGVVQAFAGSTTPDGWLLCDGSAVSRTDYADLYAVIGDTYGDGDGSTTFNLPDLSDRFIQGNATAGTVKSAGLPEITGNISPGIARTEGGAISNAVFGSGRVGGAFSLLGDEEQVSFYTRAGTTTGTFNTGASFSASSSNSIYGNSTTVQPPALTMRYIIKY